MKKTIAIALSLSLGFISQLSHAADTKECVAYLDAAFLNGTEAEKLPLAISAINRAYELNLTARQESDLLAVFNKRISSGLLKQDQVEGMAYFGCTQDLSTEDKQLAKESINTLLGMK